MAALPRIVVTLAVAAGDPAAERKNQLYLEALRGRGAVPIPLDATSAPDERSRTLQAMDGLLLTGGADIDPARYGQSAAGAVGIDPERDALEAEAWATAEARRVPVLGICRGLQAINVFSGGSLIQDLADHRAAASGAALTHPLRMLPGTRLAGILTPNGRTDLLVNSYHHQAVGRSDLAAGLVQAALAASKHGEIVEGLEAAGERFVLAVQCHPERTNTTPAGFDRLWAAFIDACR